MRKKTTTKVAETKATNAAAVETAATAAETKEPVKEAEAVAEKTADAEKVEVKEVKEVKEDKKTETAAVEKKRPGRPAGKPSTKEAKSELKPEIYIQFQNKEAALEDAIQKAKDEYVAAGHRVSSIKSLQVYLKPEDYAAYYVINQKFSGRVDLF